MSCAAAQIKTPLLQLRGSGAKQLSSLVGLFVVGSFDVQNIEVS